MYMNKEKREKAIENLTTHSNSTISGAQVYGWLKEQIKILPLLSLIFFIVGTFIWVTYAKPQMKKIVIDTVKPFVERVDRNCISVDKNNKKIEALIFENKQQLFLLKKMASKKILKEMKEQTEMFRPK